MIPSNVEPSWYCSYWYDERPSPSDRPAAHLLDSLRARRAQQPRAGDNRRRLDPALLLRLKSAAAGLKDLSGDPRVDQVLAEIDLRVEVELAKVETARTA